VRLRTVQCADLALANHVCKRTYRVLNRCIGIDSVLVIEVNMVYIEALQAALDCLPNILRPAVDAAKI